MIGLDAVDIARFKHWSNYSNKQLLKIFHQHEIDYAFGNTAKTAERLAVRFAAKEAFYKALSTLTGKNYSLLFICRNIHIQHKANGAPYIIFSSELLDDSYGVHLTLTHTNKTAIALVMFSKIGPN